MSDENICDGYPNKRIDDKGYASTFIEKGKYLSCIAALKKDMTKIFLEHFHCVPNGVFSKLESLEEKIRNSAQREYSINEFDVGETVKDIINKYPFIDRRKRPKPVKREPRDGQRMNPDDGPLHQPAYLDAIQHNIEELRKLQIPEENLAPLKSLAETVAADSTKQYYVRDLKSLGKILSKIQRGYKELLCPKRKYDKQPKPVKKITSIEELEAYLRANRELSNS